MKIFFIIGIFFISSFFYYAIGLLFYNFLVDFISRKLYFGNWAFGAYQDCPVIATALWPIIFIFWLGQVLLALPFLVTYKILEKFFYI